MSTELATSQCLVIDPMTTLVDVTDIPLRFESFKSINTSDVANLAFKVGIKVIPPARYFPS